MKKRLFDLVAAGSALALLSPAMLALALWVKLDTPGPVFAREARVGRNGMLFNVFRFRTLADRARSRHVSGIGHDPRVTRAGHLLRRWRLDGLPQLLNVVQGSMSLIGPRPETPEQFACLPPPVRAQLLSVAPGMIDFTSSLHGQESALLRNAADPQQVFLETVLPARLAHYTRYAQQRSCWLDLRIILHTLRGVLR